MSGTDEAVAYLRERHPEAEVFVEETGTIIVRKRGEMMPFFFCGADKNTGNWVATDVGTIRSASGKTPMEAINSLEAREVMES